MPSSLFSYKHNLFFSFQITFAFYFQNLIFSLSFFLALLIMDAARTPDLLVWDLVLPLIHPLSSSGLSVHNDIPLLIDLPSHICGSSSSKVSAWFIYFSYKIRLDNTGLLFYKCIFINLTKRNCIKLCEIDENWKNLNFRS